MKQRKESEIWCFFNKKKFLILKFKQIARIKTGKNDATTYPHIHLELSKNQSKYTKLRVNGFFVLSIRLICLKYAWYYNNNEKPLTFTNPSIFYLKFIENIRSIPWDFKIMYHKHDNCVLLSTILLPCSILME